MLDLQYGILFAIVAMLAWGISDFFIAIAVRKAGVVKATVYFLVFTIVIFLILLLRIPLGTLSYSSILPVLALGITIAVGNLAFSKGLHDGQVSIIVTIVSTWAIVTVALSLLLLHEPLTLPEAAGVAAIIIGVILASFRLPDIKRAKVKNISKGVPFAIITAISWGIYYFILGIFTAQVGWFQAAFLYNLPAVFFMIMFGIATRKDISFPKVPIALLIFGLAALNVIGLIGYNLSVTYGYIAVTAPITSAAVMVTVMMAFAFLKERPEKSQLFGIALVIAGIILVSL